MRNIELSGFAVTVGKCQNVGDDYPRARMQAEAGLIAVRRRGYGPYLH
jgi:hypothetical protein